MTTPASMPEPAANGRLGLPLLSLPMGALLGAQFLSALADNALFILAIALVKQGGGGHLVPYVQSAFVVAFILLAPFAGPFADALPKGRVLMIGNGVKLAGAVGLALGVHPLLAYNLVGVGATVYSPAKYGILSQMFTPDRLVKANGLLEGSTIAAILLGVVLGGLLADHSLEGALWITVGLYTLAAAVNLLIPRLPPEHPLTAISPLALVREFIASLRSLWNNVDARFSLLGTSLFWGAGSTLRLMLFAWVPVALGITDNQMPANLMGVVSIGIVIGAGLAGLLVRLEAVNRALIGGLALGPAALLLAVTGDLYLAIALLVVVGVAGGFFVVPLNALLQERGHGSVGAGHALAVQNFWENGAMFVFSLLYGHAQAAGAPVAPSVAAFGLFLLIGAGALTGWRLRRA